jgi:hypothetical protein
MTQPTETIRPFTGVDPACYAHLFGDEQVRIEQVETYIEPGALGYTGLCRTTTRTGRTSRKASRAITAIETKVGQILSRDATLDWSQLSQEDPNSEAHPDPETLPQVRQHVGALVVGILTAWEKAALRSQPPKPGPLHTPFGPRAVILETAAAVLSAGRPDVSGFDVYRGTHERRRFVAGMARLGPGYLGALHDGTFLEQWMAEQGMDETARAECREVCSLTVRKQAVSRSGTDPAQSLIDTYNYYKSLAPDVVRGALGWSDEEVAKFVTPLSRARLALRFRDTAGEYKDPYHDIKEVKRLIDEVLTDEAIAETFGWTAEQAAGVFPQSVRLEIVTTSRTDPLGACRKAVAAARSQPNRRLFYRLRMYNV